MSDATETNNSGEAGVWKGLVAGLVGGLVASWTMNRFQDLLMKLSVNAGLTGITIGAFLKRALIRRA